jgi:phosphosulfolactate synthase (CoM biosynthesis protein A)
MIRKHTPEEERAFSFIHLNDRQPKPRKRGVTEIRGPYYTVVGKRYLADVLETAGAYVDALKFAGGSFALMPRKAVRELIDLCHSYNVLVSTGGFIEYVLTKGPEMVNKYIQECKGMGFDIIEISTGFITMPQDDILRLVEKVHKAGLKAKPEVGIQFGAGGTTSSAELEAEGTRDPGWAIQIAKRCLEAGAYLIMIESEGITESVTSWRADVPAQFVDALGLEHVMFEAADPPVFEWYVKNYGSEVNLFVDHSQIIHLESIRSGTWGTKSLWGRVVNYKG